MANEAEAQSIVTDTFQFGEVPVHGRNMFSVLEGMPADVAISHAACVVDGLRELAHKGVEANGIEPQIAWLMSANLDTVFALLTSVEMKVARTNTEASA